MDDLESKNSDNEISVDSQPHYSNRIHSVHRNGAYNAQNSSNLYQAYEARTGGDVGRTLRRNTHSDYNIIENHANLIVTKMEQDPNLMEDTPLSEELRREALRDMPQCLTLKRCVKVKLSKCVSQKKKRKPISCWKNLKYKNSMFMTKMQQNLKSLMYSCELWYGALKRIEGNFGSGVGSFFKFLRCIFIVNLLITVVSFSFIVLPQVVYQTVNKMWKYSFDWHNILTGEGSLENTPLFYGFYSNSSVSFSYLAYSMPYAYFFTMVIIYLSCFAFISYSLASSYKRSFIETEGGLKNIYAHKIFCGWDYSIATKEAAELKSNAIYNELRELLYDCTNDKKRRGCSEICWSRIIQLIANLLIIFLMLGSGYLIWFLMERTNGKNWSPIYLPVTVNIIMWLLPIAFSIIVEYEGYNSPKKIVFLNLIRTFVLGCVVIGVLIGFWLKNVFQECWETRLGQEVYRLLLYDFIFSIIISPFFELLTYAIFKITGKGYLNFDISRCSMQIIYNQGLFWLGFVFAPLLPVLVVVKLLILWYVREVIVLNLCKPSSKTWRAAQATTWFLVMIFLELLLIGGLIGYMITFLPAADCGPFRNHDYIYQIVIDGILNLRENNRVFNVLLYTTKPGFIALVLIALCCRIYYLRAKAHAQREVVAIYREMLVWESRDKEFLLKKISNITRGQWQYNLEETRDVDPIISLPNLRGHEAGDANNFLMDISSDSSPGCSTCSENESKYSLYKKND